MWGYGENRGIIPLTCQELFKRIDMIKADTTREVDFEVNLQMFDIYNEKIQDLSIPLNKKTQEVVKIQ